MCGRREELRASGADVVLVGTGAVAFARAFQREFAGGLPVLTDPLRLLFGGAGMRRGLLGVLHPRLLWNALRALRGGHRQARVQGDAWQLGGALVLAADGRVVHRQVDRAGGDPLDLDRVLACLRRERSGPPAQA